MRPRGASLDLWLTILFQVTASAAILYLPEWQSPIRIAAGLLLVLVVPGYALAALLFPRSSDIAPAERLAAVLGLSIITVPLLGLLLNFTWSIELRPMLLLETGFVVVVALLALLRRTNIAAEEVFQPIRNGRPFWQWSALCLVFALAFGGSVLLAQSTERDGGSTEFYVLGADLRLEGYPLSVPAGSTYELTLGVRNLEGSAESFKLRLPAGADEERRTVSTPSLANGEAWEETFTLPAPTQPGSSEATFDLFLPESLAPYRTLKLALVVNDAPM